MLSVWSALLFFASAQSVLYPPPFLKISEVDAVPDWVVDQWTHGGQSLLEAFDWRAPGPSPSGVTLAGTWADQDDAVQSIIAFYADGHIQVGLVGRGWAQGSASARRTVQQNLAHELAHVWQTGRFDNALEPRWVHEGFAEALSLVALERSGMWTAVDVSIYRDTQFASCADVMDEGPIFTALEREDRAASYACGLLLIDTTARAARLSINDLFSAYVGGLAEGKGLADIAKELAPIGFLGQVDRLITPDYSGKPTAQVIAAFRAGRL